MSAKRSIEELLTTEEPAWPMVQQWIQAAHNSVEVLPADEAAGREALLEAQVTLRSPMGAVVYHTGGILVDHAADSGEKTGTDCAADCGPGGFGLGASGINRRAPHRLA